MATPDDCPLIEGPDMRATLVLAARDVLSDRALMSTFWEGGFDELSKHGKRHASDFLFGKFLSWVGGALVGLGMYLIIRFGVGK